MEELEIEVDVPMASDDDFEEEPALPSSEQELREEDPPADLVGQREKEGGLAGDVEVSERDLFQHHKEQADQEQEKTGRQVTYLFKIACTLPPPQAPDQPRELVDPPGDLERHADSPPDLGREVDSQPGLRREEGGLIQHHGEHEEQDYTGEQVRNPFNNSCIIPSIQVAPDLAMAPPCTLPSQASGLSGPHEPVAKELTSCLVTRRSSQSISKSVSWTSPLHQVLITSEEESREVEESLIHLKRRSNILGGLIKELEQDQGQKSSEEVSCPAAEMLPSTKPSGGEAGFTLNGQGSRWAGGTVVSSSQGQVEGRGARAPDGPPDPGQVEGRGAEEPGVPLDPGQVEARGAEEPGVPPDPDQVEGRGVEGTGETRGLGQVEGRGAGGTSDSHGLGQVEGSRGGAWGTHGLDEVEGSTAGGNRVRRVVVHAKGALIQTRVASVSTPGSYSLTKDHQAARISSSVDHPEAAASQQAACPNKQPPPAGSVTGGARSEGGAGGKPSAQEKRQKKADKVNAAVAYYREGNTIRDTARMFGVSKSVVHGHASGTNSAPTRGKKSLVMEREKEVRLAARMDERCSLGVGLDYYQAALIIQRCLQDIVSANPGRMTGFENSNQFPDYQWCRRFAARNNLVLRVASEMKRGKEQLTEKELREWFRQTALMMQEPVVQDILKNPARVLNFDETSIDLSAGRVRVLGRKGRREVQGRSSGSRNHSTLAVTVNGAGGAVPPRFVLEGTRNVSSNYMKYFPPGVKFGQSTISYSESGFVNMDIFMKILQDIHEYCVKNVPLPVLLFIDGASCHISLEATTLAKELGIRLWLLYPNATHLIQPLDVAVFRPFKQLLKQLVWKWHGQSENMSSSLSKYLVAPMVLHSLDTVLCHPKRYVTLAWRKSGLLPLNPEAISWSSLAPSRKFRDNSSSFLLYPGRSESSSSKLLATERDEGSDGEQELQWDQEELQRNQEEGAGAGGGQEEAGEALQGSRLSTVDDSRRPQWGPGCFVGVTPTPFLIHTLEGDSPTLPEDKVCTAPIFFFMFLLLLLPLLL